MLLEWLQRPHVKEWWDDGDDSLDKVAAHYSRDPEETKRFVLQLAGADAGYLQYHGSQTAEIGIDLFLARAGDLSRGIGRRVLPAFMEMILAREAPQVISIDPQPDNERAIRCYEACGFRHEASRSSPSCHYMTKRC